MNERVRLYGGELHAGRRTDTHGFEVRARIPFDRIGRSPHAVISPASADRLSVAPERGLRWRWLDPACAAVLLVALEIGVLTGEHRHGPLGPEHAGRGRGRDGCCLAPALAVVVPRRRRGARGGDERVPHDRLTTRRCSAAYFLLVPAYTAAAWLARAARPCSGSHSCSRSAAISELIAHHQPIGNLAGATFTISAAWAAGRAIRAYRSLTSELAAHLRAAGGRARGPGAAGRRRRAFANRERAARDRGAQRRGDGRSGGGAPQHARRDPTELTRDGRDRGHRPPDARRDAPPPRSPAPWRGPSRAASRSPASLRSTP